MAKIPTAADIAQVTPGSLPRINVPTGAFGERSAKAQEQLGDTITNIGLDMKKRADEADAKDLDAQFDARLRLIEFGDGTDENPGYYSRLGKSAIDKHGESQTAIDQALEEIKGKAGSAASRRLFEKSAAARMKSTLNKMSSHRATQFGEYEKGVSIARQNSAVESAIANAQNEVERKKHMGVVRKEAHDRAKKQFGDDPEIIKRAMDKATSDANVKIIDSLMTQRVNGARLAKKYFEENLAGFDPSIREATRLKIEKVHLEDLAQRYGDGADSVDLTNPDLQRVYLDNVRKNLSGAEEKAAVAEVKRRITEQVARKNAKKAEAAVAAYKHIYIDKKPMAEFARDNSEMFELIAGDGPLMSSLKRTDADAQFASRSDGTTVTDYQKRALDNPAGLEDPNSIRHKLTKTEFNKATTIFNTAQKKAEAAKNNATYYTMADKALSQVAPRPNLRPSAKKGNSETQRARQELQSSLHDWVTQYVEREKKGPSMPEIKKEASRLVLSLVADPVNTGRGLLPKEGEGAVRGYLWQFRRRTKNMSEQQKKVARVPYDKIPSSTRETIVKVLKENKKIPQNTTVYTEQHKRLIEDLTGAYALSDRDRYRMILGLDQEEDQ